MDFFLPGVASPPDSSEATDPSWLEDACEAASPSLVAFFEEEEGDFALLISILGFSEEAVRQQRQRKIGYDVGEGERKKREEKNVKKI